MSKLHQLTAAQAFGTHHRPDQPGYEDYRHYVDKGRLLRSRFWRRVFSAAGRLVRTSVETLRQQHRRQLALRELNRLDDHILQDIGIERSRIENTVDTMLQSEQQQQSAPAVVTSAGYRRGNVAAAGELACNDEPRRRVVNG